MILTNNQTAEIKGAIASALERVYSQDFSLIERRAHERSISFRFGLYFSEIIELTSFGDDADLTIDAEYNRNLHNTKNMEGFNAPQGILPDIILHHRGFNDKNIVVIEFKGYWSGNGRDDEKLRGFTHQEFNDYQYGLGLFIRLMPTLDECELVYYKNGDLE
ncbi:MAG: hypothetical protein IPK35_22450 [Saprospiraceae bacterium]|jgi:hypothetical protein|nr:hypothetical protein [Saprospiraceae bacterium]